MNVKSNTDKPQKKHVKPKNDYKDSSNKKITINNDNLDKDDKKISKNSNFYF